MDIIKSVLIVEDYHGYNQVLLDLRGFSEI